MEKDALALSQDIAIDVDNVRKRFRSYQDKAAPSSMRLDTRPFTVTRPSLGYSILVRSFRVVLFPQPFFPIRPTAWR